MIRNANFMKMDREIFEDIGLSKTEVNVYLSLLELGSCAAGRILEKSGMQSSVVHRALQNLIEKGLISFVKIGKNRQYQTTDPGKLLTFIEAKKKKIEDLLPELKQRQSKDQDRVEVEMFLGKKALFSLLDHLISDAKEGEEYLSFSLIEAHDDKSIVTFYKHYNLRRREKKLNVKVLVNEKVKAIYERNYTLELLKKANVHYTQFNFPQGIIIFRNVVIFINWQENAASAVRITSKEMANQFRQFFLEAYERESVGYF